MRDFIFWTASLTLELTSPSYEFQFDVIHEVQESKLIKMGKLRISLHIYRTILQLALFHIMGKGSSGDTTDNQM